MKEYIAFRFYGHGDSDKKGKNKDLIENYPASRAAERFTRNSFYQHNSYQHKESYSSVKTQGLPINHDKLKVLRQSG